MMRDQMLAKQVGQSVATWRKIQGITSAELAERAGVSRDTVRRLEGGDASGGFATVISIARVLGISERLSDAFDPAQTDYGRARLVQGLPERVRK